jgi:hypothetical protein
VISVNYYLRKKFLTARWPPSASCVVIVSVRNSATKQTSR